MERKFRVSGTFLQPAMVPDTFSLQKLQLALEGFVEDGGQERVEFSGFFHGLRLRQSLFQEHVVRGQKLDRDALNDDAFTFHTVSPRPQGFIQGFQR